MNQKERLLNHLELYGSINPLQACEILGIYRLSDTIYRLRCDGHQIDTYNLYVKNKFGEQCIMGEYHLINPFTII